MIKRMVKTSLFLLLSCLFVGCLVKTKPENQEIIKEDSVHKIMNTSDRLEDNKYLYSKDTTSVKTMYLTVSRGNESEHTDHSWQEVNSHSVYYYQQHGIERYGVNGLLQVGDENGPVAGELGDQQSTPNAIVTIRGQTSSRNAQKNYKIELKKGKGTWNEQRVINLNKHQTDGVRFTNKLMFDLMVGLPDMMSLQTQLVHLYVKDLTEDLDADFVDYGLYTQVEQPNKSYLQRHKFDKNGQLYKINFFEFHRNEDVIKLKNDPEYDQDAFEQLLEIKGDDDHSKLINMLSDLNDYSIPIEEVVDQWFQKDNILSWLAFHILTGNVDTQSRNTLLYSPLNETKWYFMSWDCDDAFKRTEKKLESKVIGPDWECGISNYWGNILFQRMFKSNELLEQLDQKIEEYRTYLSEERLEELVTKYKKVTKKFAFSEPDKLHEPLTEEEFEQVCNSIPKEVAKNYDLYQESLKKPMPFYVHIPQKEGNGIVFNWGQAYTLSLQDVKYRFELANNPEFKDAIITEENLFVPEYKYNKELPRGQYFIRIKAVTNDGVEQSAFDYYTADGAYYFGIMCFYVAEDGTIEVEHYEE